MKRFVLLILLLAMALSMTGCLTVTGGNDQPDELPPEEQHLTADVDETEVWHRRHDDVWSGQDEPELVSRDFERISGAAANGMTVGQELLLLDFMDCYYQSIGQLRVIDPADLFAEPKEVVYHKTIWHDLCVIRKLSPIDLTMTSYSYALRCESITPSEETEGDVDMVLRESNVTYFAGLNGIPSEQFGIKHTFTLRGVGDRWLIVRHWSDDNAYYSADYDEETQQDRNFPAITDYIQARRELPRDEQTVSATAAHPYDRTVARQYMLSYVGKRNGDFKAYDDYGGNCMNFGSQVLLAGGIPMDEQGGDKWYWYGQNTLDLSWINVGKFYSYARDNRGYGLVADPEANYYTGDVGDILILGPDGGHNHTTVISGIVRDAAGQTVDYLLCSNTTNYTDFPAGAYYYTSHRLVKIYGWNDVHS